MGGEKYNVKGNEGTVRKKKQRIQKKHEWNKRQITAKAKRKSRSLKSNTATWDLRLRFFFFYKPFIGTSKEYLNRWIYSTENVTRWQISRQGPKFHDKKKTKFCFLFLFFIYSLEKTFYNDSGEGFVQLGSTGQTSNKRNDFHSGLSVVWVIFSDT